MTFGSAKKPTIPPEVETTQPVTFEEIDTEAKKSADKYRKRLRRMKSRKSTIMTHGLAEIPQLGKAKVLGE